MDENPITEYKIACYVDRITAHYIVVKPTAPYKSYEEFVDYVKKNPGKVSFGTSIGSRNHFKFVEWASAAGLDFKWVESGKTAASISSILGGHIDVTAIDASNALSYAKSGDLRILCCSDEPLERNEINKDVKTWEQLGFTNLKCQDPIMMFVSKKVPDQTVQEINEVLFNAYSNPEMIEYMKKKGSTLKPYDLAKSNEIYKDCFEVYDQVGAILGVKAKRK